MSLADELIDRLREDPDVAKELGIARFPSDTSEDYEMRLYQMQIVYRQAKIDANFLLGQLNFELGKFDETISWMNKRTLNNRLAEKWHAAARYTMARAYQQQGKIEEAVKALNADGSPMEAGIACAFDTSASSVAIEGDSGAASQDFQVGRKRAEHIEAEMNAGLHPPVLRIISISGNIAPQSAGALESKSFGASDVLIIVLYEEGKH